ncbi:unnamed protein product [Rhizophagus irregularis]|nr:unnamed protein product [Rhizophagus irregularis]
MGHDFGTTYSRFAYKSNPSEITVLKYDENLELLSCEFPALVENQVGKINLFEQNPAEKFKLHLSKMEDKPPLLDGLSYKVAISQYLENLLEILWPDLKFSIIMSVNFIYQSL